MNDHKRWNEVNAICMRALELNPSDRVEFVERRCDGDTALFENVQQLLTAAETDDGFLDPPASGENDEPSFDVSFAPGDRIGRYAVVQLLSDGGMGRVYLGRRADASYEQVVAIKVLRSALTAPSQRERFDLERQTLAQLQHPNITMLLDGGTTEAGVPYLVMEYVDGPSIVEYGLRHHISIQERLRLFLEVCSAVQHAHSSLIVHRDIKPGNVLVDQSGRVKLIDFGIAKLLDSGSGGSERSVTVVRTPAYASPEQIRGQAITTRTDVHGLGVLLYELLADVAPFTRDGCPVYELERRICESDPRPPSHVAASAAHRRVLRGDLDAVCLRAMAREPGDRYGSVEQLRSDVESWLELRPVSAARMSRGARFAKFLRRHRVPASLAFAIGLMVATLCVTTVIGWSQARIAADDALSAHREAIMAVDILKDVLHASDPLGATGASSLPMVLAAAEQRIAAVSPNSTALRARLHLAMAQTYRQLASWRSCSMHSASALRFLEAGESSGDAAIQLQRASALVTRSISETEVAYARGSGNRIAIKAAEEALSIRRGLLGSDDPLTAEAMHALALAMWIEAPDAAGVSRALDLCLDALAVYASSDAAISVAAAEAWSLSAHLHRERGSSEARLEALERSHAMYDALDRSPPRARRMAMILLAQARLAHGHDEDARALFVRFLMETPDHLEDGSHVDVYWTVAGLERRVGSAERALDHILRAIALEAELVRAAGDDESAQFLNELAVQVERWRDNRPIEEVFASLYGALRSAHGDSVSALVEAALGAQSQ